MSIIKTLTIKKNLSLMELLIFIFLFSYWRVCSMFSTLAINSCFLIALPLSISIFSQNNLLALALILVVSAMELCIDHIKYKPSNPITAYTLTVRALVTVGFNSSILYGASLILANLNGIFALPAETAGVILSGIAIAYVYLVSVLETAIDKQIY